MEAIHPTVLLSCFFNEKREEYEIWSVGSDNFLETIIDAGDDYNKNDWDQRRRDEVRENIRFGCNHEHYQNWVHWYCADLPSKLTHFWSREFLVDQVSQVLRDPLKMNKTWIYRGRWLFNPENPDSLFIFLSFDRFNLFDPDTIRWTEIPWKSDDYLIRVNSLHPEKTTEIKKWICGLYIEASKWMRYSDESPMTNFIHMHPIIKVWLLKHENPASVHPTE